MAKLTPDQAALLASLPRSVLGCSELHSNSANRIIKALDSGRRVSLQDAKLWAHTLASVLAAYNLPDNWDVEEKPREQIPRWIVVVLYKLLQFFIDANLPEPVRTLIKRGGTPGPGPNMRRDIGRAVAYIVAARAGDISDDQPVRTICNHFKVSTRTVQNWMANLSWMEPSDLLNRVPETQRPMYLIERMKEAGARYARQGRSAHAIQQRGKKAAPRGRK
jgi:hypothetical protein